MHTYLWFMTQCRHIGATVTVSKEKTLSSWVPVFQTSSLRKRCKCQNESFSLLKKLRYYQHSCSTFQNTNYGSSGGTKHILKHFERTKNHIFSTPDSVRNLPQRLFEFFYNAVHFKIVIVCQCVHSGQKVNRMSYIIIFFTASCALSRLWMLRNLIMSDLSSRYF